MNVTVAYEAEPGSVIEEGENEWSVGECEVAKGEAMGAQDVAAASCSSSVCGAGGWMWREVGTRQRGGRPNFLMHLNRQLKGERTGDVRQWRQNVYMCVYLVLERVATAHTHTSSIEQATPRAAADYGCTLATSERIG
jgi:hypothetical protein